MDRNIIHVSDLIDRQHEAKITFYLDKIPSKITAKTSLNQGNGNILIDNSSCYDSSFLKGEVIGDKAVLTGLEHYYKEKGWHFLSFTSSNGQPERFDIELITEFEDKEEISFSEKIIKILKEELEILDKTRRNALNNHNHSDYKLIINNYKQVIELIQELEGSKKPQEINVKMNDNWSGIGLVDSEFIKKHWHIPLENK